LTISFFSGPNTSKNNKVTHGTDPTQLLVDNFKSSCWKKYFVPEFPTMGKTEEICLHHSSACFTPHNMSINRLWYTYDRLSLLSYTRLFTTKNNFFHDPKASFDYD